MYIWDIIGKASMMKKDAFCKKHVWKILIVIVIVVAVGVAVYVL